MPGLQGHGRRAVCKHLRLPWGNLKQETGRAADLLTLLLAAVPSVCAGWEGEGKRGSDPPLYPQNTCIPTHAQTPAVRPPSQLQTGL